jgi:hypothetical protein
VRRRANFHPSHFGVFTAADSEVQRRVSTQYQGTREDFGIIFIGSGVGGGLLADALMRGENGAAGGPRGLSTSRHG